MKPYQIVEVKNDEFHEFNVDKAQVMKNLSDHYTIPLEDAVIVENLDNCIDEPGYTRVDFEFTNGSLIITMKGTGISKKIFENLLHTLAGTTKTDKPGLGHYGWGMKVGLAISEYMTIKTKKGDFFGAQEWKMDTIGVPQWRPLILPPFDQEMTIIEHKLKKEYLKNVSLDSLEKSIQYYYPTILNGAPVNGRIIQFFLNGKKIKPSLPEFDRKKEIKIKIGGNDATGKLFYRKKGFNEDFDKIKIIVYGRRILDECFGLPTNNKISGYIHADMLYNIVASDKTAIKRTNPLWKNFAKESGKILSAYLKEIGEFKEDTSLDADLLKQLHEEINNTLKHFPDLFGDFRAGTNKTRKPVLVQNSEGMEMSTLLTGGQESLSHFSSNKKENNSAVEGQDNSIESSNEIDGITPATKKMKTVKVGVQIRTRPFQNLNRESEFDYNNSTVWINTAFPTFQKISSQNKKVLEYHMVRCSFDALLAYVITTKGKTDVKDFLDYRADILSKWCET